MSLLRQALGEELARRLGRERCWRVRWPGRPPPPSAEGEEADPEAAAQRAAEDAAYRKDANEVLVKDGKEALAQCVQAAEPYPIRGLFRCVPCVTTACGVAWCRHRFTDFYADLRSYYNLDFAREEVFSTGWPPLDDLYRVRCAVQCSAVMLL